MTRAANAAREVPAIVLAGGVPRAGEPLWSETRGGPKALLDVAGAPMVQRVLDALSEATRAGPVALVGLEAAAVRRLVYARRLEPVPARGAFVDNLYAGIEAIRKLAPAAERALYCGSDVPLARGAMIDRFVDDASLQDADVVASVVRRTDLESRFPEVREAWLRLREGRFVAADLALFRPAAAARARSPLESLAPRRKSAWRQARQVGLGLLARYLLGLLTLPALERRIERAFGIRARILIARDPELGLDVDGPLNLEICRRTLAGELEAPESATVL